MGPNTRDDDDDDDNAARKLLAWNTDEFVAYSDTVVDGVVADDEAVDEGEH